MPRLLTLLCFLLGVTVFAQPATRLRIVALNTPGLWAPLEFRIENAPPAVNRFDPDELRIDVLVRTPAGEELRVPAYWYQDYRASAPSGEEQLVPIGEPHWRLRFTATVAGAHTLTPLFSAKNGPEEKGDALVVAIPAAAVGTTPGWIRASADRLGFETSDGRPLRLIGANVCWPEKRGTLDYRDWFDAMQKGGQNFARIWMAPWWAGIEHRPGRLNHYPLEEAWRLDEVFRLAEARGIYLLLCFDHHGMFQRDSKNWGGANNFWPTNPYAVEQGGPCATPNDFFTDSRAAEIYRKRLRYLVARYGSSPYLHSWQFFNEIDNVFAPVGPLKSDDVVAWHRTMARHLRSIDPWKHLIGTSLTGGSDRPEIWTLPEMDFAVYHSYGDASPATTLATLSRSYAARYKKPFVVGEFGMDAGSWNIAADPYLRGFRQALWGATLGGSAGTPMSWWWQDIHADRAWQPIEAVASIMRSAGWDRPGWTPISFAPQPDRPEHLSGAADDKTPFSSLINLHHSRDSKVDGRFAISDSLSAQRAADHLSSFLHGSRRPALRTTHHVEMLLAPQAVLILKVKSVAGSAELVVRCGSDEICREKLGIPAEQAPKTQLVGREFRIPLPPGKQVIEVANDGIDYILLESMRVEALLPARLAPDWHYPPELIGLQRPGAAVLYIGSPELTYPANALRYRASTQAPYHLVVPGLPPGPYLLRWHEPRTGALLSETTLQATKEGLDLVTPAFEEDLVAVILAR